MDVTAELMHEHDAILGAIDILERICRQVDDGGEFPAGDLSDILDFLKNFADGCHHAKEEQHLFPALTRAGLPAEGGPVAVMLAEHDLGRKYIREMSAALGGEGVPASSAAFSRSARAYGNLLRAHIGKENNILFPMAERFIPPDSKARVAEAFARLEEERTGRGVHERYHEMLRGLGARYAAEAHHAD